MVSSGSSLESTHHHSRREHRRGSRSRDTRPPMDEPDYGDDEPLHPPPGTEIASGPPEPTPHSEATVGDPSQHNIPTSTTPTNPVPFPPTPPAHLSDSFFPPPRVPAPRPRFPLSQPRATGPPPLNPYGPRPPPRHTSRTTRSPIARHHDRRRSPRSRSAHSRRRRGHRHRSHAASRSRRDDRHRRRSHSRRRRSRTHQREHRHTSNRPRSHHSSRHRDRSRADQTAIPPATSDRDSSVATPLRLLPGPGDQPTPPKSATRPTTPPQAFQPPPVPPLTTLPTSEQEELRQLRLQFQQQQQQAAHHLQQQAFLQSSFNPFFSPYQFFLPPPSLSTPPSHPPTDPSPAKASATAPEPAPAITQPADFSISLFSTSASTQPPISNQPASTPRRPTRPVTPPRLSLQWSQHQPDFHALEASAKLGYFMANIVEVAIDIGPQQQIWTTPFWLQVRPSGPGDLWYEIWDNKFHDWLSLLSMVKQFRRFLIDDPHRPCSWEECEAPETLPRPLLDTTLHELVRLLPLPLRRISATSRGDNLGDFLATLSHVPQILEKSPVFLWGKLPCHDALFLLLKLDYPKTDHFQQISSQTTTYTFVHNCPGVSLRGILTDGVIRPSSWKGEGDDNSEYIPSLGFYCRCCYPGHSHTSDNRINPDITHRLTPELQCALHVACIHGGRTSGRRYFVAGECFSRQFQHYVVRSGGLVSDALASHFYDVVRNRVDSRYKCRSSTSQVQYAGLFIRTMNYLLTDFDALTYLFDHLFRMYHILLAALRQLVAIFCPRSSLPRKRSRMLPFPLSCIFLLFPFSCTFVPRRTHPHS